MDDLCTLGNTPIKSIYHSASQCFVILTESPSGSHGLSLVDPFTLQQVARMDFDEMHIPCDIKVAALPCSSADSSLGFGNKVDACFSKEFLLVLGYITDSEGW